MKRVLSIFLTAVLTLSSCGIYEKYEDAAASCEDTVHTQLPSWREFFADPLLQDLIDSALVANSSLSVAALRLRQADENLRAANLAYIPSFFFEPSGGISLHEGHGQKSFQLPLNVGWNYGAPGSLFARKHQAQARRIQSQDNYDAALNELISQIASDYYILQMLDEQVGILERTISVWERTLKIQREYMLSGRTHFSSVAQMESKVIDARQDLLQARADIAVWERAICLLMAKPHCRIARSVSGSCPEPELLETGVDMNMLRSRPDVRAAGRDMEIAYYLTTEARSAFFPAINLNGGFGWPTVVNAALSMTQPIFARGALRSRLNVSEMDRDIARVQFNQTLLQAATEVSQAIADYHLYSEKAVLYSQQTAIQEKACRVVEEISRDGKANYLELIKAQEGLLSAQLGKAQSTCNAREAAVRLYKALGL